VGLGIEAAVSFSRQLGFVSETHERTVREIFAPLTSAARPKILALAAKDVVDVMRSDKKNTSAEISFILTRGFGQMFKHALPVDQACELLQVFLRGDDHGH